MLLAISHIEKICSGLNSFHRNNGWFSIFLLILGSTRQILVPTAAAQLRYDWEWRPVSLLQSDREKSWQNQFRSTQERKLERTTKRLLAVRVSSSLSGEVPAESIASIQGAIFGFGSNPDNISFSDGTVVAQYAALSHEQLLFEPATNTETNAAGNAGAIQHGVLDVIVDNISFVGQSITNVTATILEQTQKILGVLSLLDIADHFIFCLPKGGIYNNDANWTAFTFLFEPVRFRMSCRH
jgi:hypothetical protein